MVTVQKSRIFAFCSLLLAILLVSGCDAWILLPSCGGLPSTTPMRSRSAISPAFSVMLLMTKQQQNEECSDPPPATQSLPPLLKSLQSSLQTTALALAIVIATWISPLPLRLLQPPVAHAVQDPSSVVSCLFRKCPVPLGKCILNPKCLANVICINTCNGRPDEIDCQIKCGDLFDNAAVAEFNCCAVSDMDCVKQKPDDGSYPVPKPDVPVPRFSTKLWNGRWYITAGQNPLFDTFPCQVHFFTETEPGRFVGKLNWRITEPDGEFFTRDAIQTFVQDKDQPAHLINHDNEFLHYEDDWWIIDYEYDNNPDNVPPFAFVYYRGSNDAWDGYGGAVVYTRDDKLPESLLPRLRAAAAKVNFDFDRDFTVTDNSCPTELSEGDKILLREQFAGKVLLQSEEQLRAEITRLRGNAVSSVEEESSLVAKAIQNLENKAVEFEKEVVQDAIRLEQELVRDATKLEEEIVKDATKLEKEIVKDVEQIEERLIKRNTKVSVEVNQ